MSYLEDLVPGDVFKHARGKTVTELEGVLLTNLVLNTAQAHFNEDAMRRTDLGGTIVFGGVVAAVVIGLATQDTAEHAVREVRLGALRFKAPVRHGDTLYAYTEVVEKSEDGTVHFRHRGVNQNGAEVFECERWVEIKSQP